jgi:hypothetical protein
MKNLEKFKGWEINEASYFTKWASTPSNITPAQKRDIEAKIEASSSVEMDILKNFNPSYNSRYWEALKKRLGENKITFKYGNTSAIPSQWIYWSEKVIYSDKRPLLSRNNSTKEEVLAYFPIPYNGVVLDKFWVVAVWKNQSGINVLREMTLKTFLTKTTKDLIDVYFKGYDPPVTNRSNSKDYWTLITIMACENFSDQIQGMADVAQSIYNRYYVKGKPYGKSISEIILAKGQYEPVSKGLKKGADWKNITSKQKAISVYMKSKGVDINSATKAINNAISAQSSKSYVNNAKSHVKTRTEFLASSPKSSSAASPVERTDRSKHNSFFWNYAGKKEYYAKRDFSAKPIPSEVKIA